MVKVQLRNATKRDTVVAIFATEQNAQEFANLMIADGYEIVA
jgi:hypothetical protein